MQFKTLSLSLFVAAATASTVTNLISQLPDCSTNCLKSGSDHIGCSETDYSCQCSNQDDLRTASLSCLAETCTTEELLTVTTVSSEICDAVPSSSSTASSASSTHSAAGIAASSAAATATGTSASSSASPSTAAGVRSEAAFSLMGAAAMVAMAL